ncbi:MAG: hypothetical protein ABEJ42_01585 [Halobacteriaceae archaeon]
MDRRRALGLCALVGLALLAGCSAAGSIDLREGDDATLAAGASRSFGAGDGPPTDADRAPSAVVAAAVANGSTTVNGTDPPVTEGLPIEHAGAYFDLTWTVVDRRPATMVDVGVDYNASRTTGADGTTGGGDAIAYEDLPAPDREALAGLFPPPPEPPRTRGVDFGVGAVYTDAELNRSVLAPTQTVDAVVYGGTRYPIETRGTRQVTAKTYRYTADRVAPNASAYAAHLRERYLFTLSNLTDAERSVLEEAATSGSYYADSPDDAAFESVLERFRAHRAVVETESSGTWIVRYDGQVYLAQLDYGGFVEDG